MSLKVPELEDQPWMPDWLRDLMTDFLAQMCATLQIYHPVLPCIDRLLQTRADRSVVDLCSGAGGPWPSLLSAGYRADVTLTDRHPHQLAQRAGDTASLRYESAAIDATRVPPTLRGARTLFSAFHHLDDTQARQVLEGARADGAPIGVFEFTERRLGRVLSDALFAPLLVLLLTPSIRPRRAARFVFTYVVPLVPLAILWDALASDLRTRTTEELEALVRPLRGPDYWWEVGTLESPRARITYLIGGPHTLEFGVLNRTRAMDDNPANRLSPGRSLAGLSLHDVRPEIDFPETTPKLVRTR